MQTTTKDTSQEARNKATKSYTNAFRAALEMRAEFSRKPGYVRKKQPDEQAYQQAKKVFGEFRPSNREIMLKNTNGGKGVDLTLPSGESVHLANQAELFDKIVNFNKERGDFYDAENIAKLNHKDFSRLEKVNGDLESAKNDLLNSFKKRSFAFKRLAAIESDVKKEINSRNEANKVKKDTRSKQSAKEKDLKPNEQQKPMNSNAESKIATTDHSTNTVNSEKPAASSFNTDLSEIPISQFAITQEAPLGWVEAQNAKSINNMRHMVALSFLQEERFKPERDHFFNEVHKRFGKSIDTVDDAEKYVAKLMNSRESDSLLRDSAPGAVAAAEEYTNKIELDSLFTKNGYPIDRVTPIFREQMQVSMAYAERIGGEVGKGAFLKALRENKDGFLKGLGDPRVGLAVSGSLLAMSVMAGTGPAGLVIGSLKVSQKLLDTEKGKAFQTALYSASVSFMEKLGVEPAVVGDVTNSIKNLWDKTIGTKWGKMAMFGAFAALSLIPSVSDNLISSAQATEIPTSFNTPLTPDSETAIASLNSTGVEPIHSDPGTTTDSFPEITSQHDGLTTGDDVFPHNKIDAPYDIQKGDTLWDIAKDTFANEHPGQVPNNIQLINMVNEIADYNEIDNPNMIYAGQTLHIPQNIAPSDKLVSGPTNWLQDQINDTPMAERFDSLNDRAAEWKKDQPEETVPPRFIERTISV